MKIEFNSLHWNNVDKDMLSAHQRVMDYFEIPMNYDNRDGHNHGMWMQWVINNSSSDVIVFMEPDCIPLNKSYLEYIKYANRNETFVALLKSQIISPLNHISTPHLASMQSLRKHMRS